MSMISEQVKHLKELSESARINVYSFETLSQSLKEAADTIEALSAELEKANEELKRWHTDHINEKIRNPFAYTSTLICHNCDHKDEYIEELEAEVEELKTNMERSESDCGGGWIPCSERLPNKTGSYLVTAYSEGISEYISDIDQFIYNGMPTGYWINSDNVIAWQPLPGPYTENEKTGGANESNKRSYNRKAD